MTWRQELGWEQPDGNNLTNDEDFDAVADEREAACAHDFGMLGVCVKCGESDPRWEEVPQAPPESLALASLLNPIREAIFMGDRGQPCVCSEQGKCYMHAQQERAEAALSGVEKSVLAAVDFVTHEGGHQSRFGARWYALVDALGEAGMLQKQDP